MAASKTYERFVSDLNESQVAVLAVAAFLQRKGYEVVLPPHVVTPSEEERYQYQDAGDLRATLPGKPTRTYQAKHSSRDFDSVEAFGFRMITVDEGYKIEAQEAKPPHGYWIVNSSMSGAIYIQWASKPDWDSFDQVDPHQGGRTCNYRRCPARLCSYVSFARAGAGC